ncbi:MAG: amino acid adenylation domain-containing protein, partial [Anaerolineae bacterium]|nr:amino acid adenylation domain-containing protein [Anaerolineae bacterium]
MHKNGLTIPSSQSSLSDLPPSWNDTSCNDTLHQMFASQAARTPQAVAVIYPDEPTLMGRYETVSSVTYAELDRRSDQLAAYLQQQGVGPETLVGVYMERSPGLMVSLLGIFKAGGAYVPLDPAFPLDRLALMVEDSGAPLILTQERLLSRLPGLDPDRSRRSLCIDRDWPLIEQSAPAEGPAATADNLAYVIYTSGSTGRPKGVAIPHRAVVNFLTSMAHEPGLTAADTLLAITTLSFDISVLELFLPLVVGAKTVILRREVAADARQLQAHLLASQATVMQATPATWRMLLESDWPGRPALKVLCGGESMPRDLADQLLARCGSLWNMYGPTETTVWSTIHPVAPGDEAVPVGRPIANTTLHVLDEQLQPVPLGTPGELFIGGDGLARGYLNRPDLTAEKFIPDPFSDTPGARLYRTGDLASYRPDGSLDFFGRIDHQVKIRGFRIELGEIESLLRTYPEVQEAVVVAREDEGYKRLVAYLKSQSPTDLGGSALRDFLKEKLPDYMIPALFVTLPELPLTP